MNLPRACFGAWLGLVFGSSLAAAPPELTSLFPAGVQQGQSVEVAAAGKFERWPVQGWADHGGLRITAGKNKGKVTIGAAPDAPPGVHYLRVYDEQGASNLRPFLVGTLPEITEQEPNDDPLKPQVLASSAVVNGRLDNQAEVDGFAFKLKQGQTLVADMTANRVLASPCDAVLQVLSPEGFVLAENNDWHGLDPQLAFTAPRDGVYLVRAFAFPSVPTAAIRLAGADTFIYRLTLTTGGYVECAFPPAVHGAAPAAVDAVGWNIPAAARSMTIPASGEFDLLTLTHPLWANTTTIRREPHATVLEAEPNGRMQPQSVSVPCTINGRIDPPDDRDVFQFTARKGQNLNFQVEARVFGSPLAPVLAVFDASGKALAQPSESTSGRRRRNDPNAGRITGPNDVELAFTAPADGTYRVELRDQYDSGSKLHIYALRALIPQPDFDVKLDTDRFVLKPGKPLEVAITVNRLEGFSGDIELQVLGLPEGVTAAPVRVGASAKSVKVVLNAPSSASSGSIQIIGQAAGPPARRHLATVPMADLNATTSHLWLTVARADVGAVK